MLSYRHGFHAGNFADVFKHFLLTYLLKQLKQNKPFSFVDPFAAAGASKGKMEAVLTAKSKIQLGRHEVGKLSFVLLDLTHINTTLSSQGALPIEGIIGADFLKKNKVVVDYRNRKLWL